MEWTHRDSILGDAMQQASEVMWGWGIAITILMVIAITTGTLWCFALALLCAWRLVHVCRWQARVREVLRCALDLSHEGAYEPSYKCMRAAYHMAFEFMFPGIYEGDLL